MSDIGRPLMLRKVTAKCTLCEWSVAQIDASAAHAHEVVDAACDRHFDEQHADAEIAEKAGEK